MIVLYILVVIAFIYAVINKSKHSLHMLQQNLYNENNRYLRWVGKNKKLFLDIDLIPIAIALIGLFVIYDIKVASIICSVIVACLFIATGYLWDNRVKNSQNKKKLVVTARIKRLITTLTIIQMIPIVWGLFHLNDPFLWWVAILILAIILYGNFFVTFIGKVINTPVEKCVYLHFKRMAQTKLKEMSNLKIIGITGSYGKTSSKNILADILNCKYNALPTPRNLNTYNGLIMTVNNNLDKFTDIFIAEMGAYVKGEIKGLCKLVKPQYGILTTIGTAHLETFGSEQNIIDGKFELIESLPKDGFAVLNGDDPKQVNYKLKNNIRTIWVGINNEDVDVRATNIKCSGDGTTFDVMFKGDPKKYSFETKLLGNHNVYNILSGIAFGKEFGIEIDDLIQAVKNVKPVEHRLELKPMNNFFMIDDAYNSNPVGAKNAVEVLGLMPGIKVVVTPGMIELGEKEDEYNKTFGEQIAEVADYVVLIGEQKTKPIKEGLLTKGFDKEKIIVYNDVRDAYPFIGTLTKDGEVFALFENDLPDTYNEK